MSNPKTNSNPILSKGGFDSFLSRAQTCIHILDECGSTYNSISGALNNRAAVKTDNAVKMAKMEAERRKLENELEKIRSEAHDREMVINLYRDVVKMLQDQQKKILEDDEFYKSPEAFSRIKEFNANLIQLVKEIKC